MEHGRSEALSQRLAASEAARSAAEAVQNDMYEELTAARAEISDLAAKLATAQVPQLAMGKASTGFWAKVHQSQF